MISKIFSHIYVESDNKYYGITMSSDAPTTNNDVNRDELTVNNNEKDNK